MNIINIKEVSVLEDFNLRLEFENGLVKLFNAKPFIKHGVSALLNNPDYFKKVQLVDGFVCWDNGFDFCPNFLYNYTPHAVDLQTTN